MGYNTLEANSLHSLPGEKRRRRPPGLIAECDVEVESAQGNFVLELSKGPDRFQARFDLADGTCTLVRLPQGMKPVDLGSAPTRMKSKGSYHVRFANVDDRLMVWVDGRLPFEKGVEYRATDKLLPTKENDLERPVSIGASSGVTVGGIKVFRDTYYTTSRGAPSNADIPEFSPTEPDTWKHMEAPVSAYRVASGHYFMLGDNSSESSDSRSWGSVPKEKLIGRVLWRYYPFARFGQVD